MPVGGAGGVCGEHKDRFRSAKGSISYMGKYGNMERRKVS
jgi:hypothetical protein